MHRVGVYYGKVLSINSEALKLTLQEVSVSNLSRDQYYSEIMVWHWNPNPSPNFTNRYSQLPLGLLNAAQGSPMLVELKNGETLNGHLINCDTWMNLTLKEVVQTSPEGDKFFRLPEVYVRGNNVRVFLLMHQPLWLTDRMQIKYLRVPDEIVDLVKDQQQSQPASRGRGGAVGRSEHAGRGDRGRGVGRGRARGRGRGG